MLYRRNVSQFQGHRDFCLFSSSSYIVLGLHLSLWFLCVNVYMSCEVLLKFGDFCICIFCCSGTICRRLSFLPWIDFTTLSKNSLSVYVWACLWTLYTVSLLCCLSLSQYYTILIMVALYYPWNQTVLSPSTLFFFTVVLALLGPSHFHRNFKISLSISILKSLLELLRIIDKLTP